MAEPLRLIVRGQGFKDGSEDVRSWRRACAERKVNPVGPATLLTAALAEADHGMRPEPATKSSQRTAEGGRRKNSRDDVAAAAILAVANAGLDRDQAPARVSYGGLI